MNWKKIPVDDTVESFDSITTIQFFGENKKSTKILVKPKPRSEVSDKSDKLETAKKLPRSEMTDNLETAKKLPRSEMTDNLETAKELPGSEMSDNLETAKESLHDAVDLQKPIQK
ncbi:uncharacterized protein [Drosophila pseudoobscura]|uniref:Uncharacterized protein isoform X2 n=1 Tax=Drosophila pseudoobscura pseudoobscura TaxID=46245 RepID=A0A6I8VIB7_DROPS|nr:uncharacterized protein LOC6901302 isoform X2 [Drosophila pseudoobscura]